MAPIASKLSHSLRPIVVLHQALLPHLLEIAFVGNKIARLLVSRLDVKDVVALGYPVCRPIAPGWIGDEYMYIYIYYIYIYTYLRYLLSMIWSNFSKQTGKKRSTATPPTHHWPKFEETYTHLSIHHHILYGWLLQWMNFAAMVNNQCHPYLGHGKRWILN